MTLLTKTQLKDYESGEFSDLQQRTWPETRALIEQFPWSREREHFAVGLTSPSITIEGPSGDYLKLALYYHDKFILYYLDTKNHLYVHSMPTIPEAYPIIQSFFDDNLDLSGFKRQSTPFTNNKAHFETKDFHYTMRGTFILPLIGVLSIGMTAFPFVTITAAIIKTSSIPIAGYVVLSTLSILFLGGGVLLTSLCINHYRASRNKILSLSRGNPLFYYGDINAPAVYDKKDIQKVVQYGGGRSNDRLSRTQIIFKDGSSINISGLILPADKMAVKFPRIDIGYKAFGLNYFIPRAFSIPS
ncbi:MAG TPA: hypothetical protein VHD83_15845 [Puia sp.]|nr:hypothetical protein [Puia sp.]